MYSLRAISQAYNARRRQRDGPVAHNLDLQIKRRELGLSQDQVARYLGCTKYEVSRFENGHLAHLRGLDRKGYAQKVVECAAVEREDAQVPA